MNSKEMSNKVKLEGEIIGDNKRISEALKEISSLEYVSWDTACRLRALSKQKWPKYSYILSN